MTPTTGLPVARALAPQSGAGRPAADATTARPHARPAHNLDHT